MRKRTHRQTRVTDAQTHADNPIT